ncbi:MAG TPA: hypothetical protein PKE64_29865 [Anaerolineae bacterium]|nr:hypothetical protein [Anaerolineae bacterium]
MNKLLDFFAALSLVPSDITKMRGLLKKYLIQTEVFKNVLITPLFVSKQSINQIRDLKERESFVLFDSGGYYVQIGRLSYHELYYPLLQFYRENTWGDVYTLPDHVPTSQDKPDVVQKKVEETAKFSRLFYLEMPDDLKSKAMGVVQGHTFSQVDLCLRTYLDLGLKYIGFGSFGTVGKNSQVNVATDNAVNLAQYVVGVAKEHSARVHFFGLGVPALAAMIFGVGAKSFDSSSWLKAAGFGQVFLPFMRAYNISHRNASSELQKGITINEFEVLRNITKHHCPFCTSIEDLQQIKLFRAMHNLICIKETVDLVNAGNFELIRKIYSSGSPKYQQEYDKWLINV